MSLKEITKWEIKSKINERRNVMKQQKVFPSRWKKTAWTKLKWWKCILHPNQWGKHNRRIRQRTKCEEYVDCHGYLERLSQLAQLYSPYDVFFLAPDFQFIIIKKTLHWLLANSPQRLPPQTQPNFNLEVMTYLSFSWTFISLFRMAFGEHARQTHSFMNKHLSLILLYNIHFQIIPFPAVSNM